MAKKKSKSSLVSDKFEVHRPSNTFITIFTSNENKYLQQAICNEGCIEARIEDTPSNHFLIENDAHVSSYLPKQMLDSSVKNQAWRDTVLNEKPNLR